MQGSERTHTRTHVYVERERERKIQRLLVCRENRKGKRPSGMKGDQEWERTRTSGM